MNVCNVLQMFSTENMSDKLFKCTIWCCIVLFTLLEVFVRTQISVHEHDTTHGFIQSNNEVRYFVDDISTIHTDLPDENRHSKLHDTHLKSYLRFEPEFLDFKERPLGVPHLEKVTLFNVNSNKSIDMTSISGNTVHFHSSFFEDKKIPPLGNTTFNIVFLGREEGEIESSLFIHTTEGSYKYQVRGASVASPYRLRPIVDIRVPLNASFSPLIYMHNPHTQPIQIVEVYSSGGEFHLELPTGELEGPKFMWEIPPFQTKPIIRIRFNARVESNYTAYVRIKVNGIKDVLVVPLEVEVSAQCGLYTPQGTLDFGVGGTLDKPKQLKLFVFNSLKKPIRVQSVTTSTKAIKVDFQPVKLLSDTKEPIEIASLTLDWKAAFDTRDFFGKIQIKYKQGKGDIEVPYWATIFEGGLFYNASVTKYLTDSNAVDYGSRNFTVINKYEFPLVVTNITLPDDAQLYFSIEKFKQCILQPKESVVLFQLILKTGVVVSGLKLKSFLIVHTNISDLEVPLLSYNGKLTMILPSASADNTLDLGLIGCDLTKDAHFILLNNNPVDIKLLNFGTNIQSGSVTLIGCGKQKYFNDLHVPPSNMSKCLSYLKSGEYAVFKVVVVSSKTEGQVLIQTFIQTHFEKIIVPIRYKVAQGKLEIGPDRLSFDECFPSKICMHPLRIHSTFADSMVIQSISSIPPDPRLSSSYSGHITMRSSKIIGHLLLDPVLGCRNHCYTGLSLNSSIGAQWLRSFSLPSSTCDLDLNLLNILYGRYLNLTSSGKKWQNLTLRLDTTEVKGHFFQTKVKMSWPKLVVGNSSGNRSVFMFPLTQIGGISYKNITIRNPSSAILTLQLVMDWAYPRAKNLFKNLPPSFLPSFDETTDSQSFFLHEMYAINRTEFQTHNVQVHEHSLPIQIPARETVYVTVGFKATVSTLKSAFMYIRNNLTILEVVRFHGQGAHPSFKFGNRKSGSTLPLLFELTEKHLKDCEKEKNRKNPSPNLTVKRSFTARNSGDIPISVKGFYINGFPCEGYGFKVLNCVPFQLLPNATRKIDIAFTPDFTLSKIQRTLILDTSLNIPVNYTLVTTLPSYFLAPCASVLARPSWEPLLYYACVSLMSFLLFIVVSICFIESDRILRTSLTVRDEVETQPLDLRLIGTQTRNEIRAQKPEPDWTNTNQLKCGKESIGSNDKSNWTEQSGKDLTGLTKYSSVPPASCAKPKKKVGKRNSLENGVETFQDSSKKSWSPFLKVQPKPKRNSPDLETEYKKSPTIVVTKVENIIKITPLQKEIGSNATNKSKKSCSEEETSSTTTESSNNEEVEKLPELKVEKPKKTVSKTKSNEFRDNYEGDGEDEDEKEPTVPLTTTNRWKRQNETTKHGDSVKTQQPKTSRSNCRERKEKSAQKKRSEKSLTMHKSDINPRHNNPVRLSPPIPPVGIWGENRATFSDVVARSDSNTLLSRTTQPTQPVKPTLYVEPTQKQKEQVTTELGPIGSRKADSSKLSGELKPPHLSNSFFTEPQHNLRLENSGSYFDLPEIWSSQENSVNLYQNNLNEANKDLISLNPFQENWNPASFWEPLCAPVGEAKSQQPPFANDYFWSAPPPATVWPMSPWTPLMHPAEPPLCDSSSTPMSVRSPPPGFGRERREENDARTQSFDPFNSLSNIWTPHSPDSWSYNTSHHTHNQ